MEVAGECKGCDSPILLVMMCFSEAERFHHVHIHSVAKPTDLPQEAKGPGIFAYLSVDQQAAVPPDEIKALSEELKEALSTSSW